jgi:hypothetical protein
MKLEDLFIGPLGRAQIGAMNYAEGMAQATAMIDMLERVEALDRLIENDDIEELERKIAEQLKEELYNSVIAIAEGQVIDNGKTIEKKVL